MRTASRQDGRVTKLNDADIRRDLAAGMGKSEIARKYGVTPGAITYRVKRANLNAAAAQVAPYEARRFTSNSLDAMEQLTKSLSKVNLLMDACDQWLRDAKDPSIYDYGPREGEVQITYEVEIETPGPKGEPRYHIEKRKKPLTELLAELETVDGERICAIKKWESKHADAREVILKTAQEARSTVHEAAELARMLADMRAMQAFRDYTIAEIAKVDIDIANRIRDAIQRSIILHTALEGPGGVSERLAAAE